MPLWLHPSHWKSGSIAPLKLAGDERTRGERLASSLTQLESDKDFEAANLTPVQFVDGFLSCETLSVPLLCADMAWLDHESPAFERADTEE